MSVTQGTAPHDDQGHAKQADLGLSDPAFIELLWRCVSMAGDLMPADAPLSNALLEWSRLQEDATGERQRREIAAADAGQSPEVFVAGQLPDEVVAAIAAADYGSTPTTAAPQTVASFILPMVACGTGQLSFQYRNWRGEVARRTVAPLGIEFGATEWHREPQWLLRALDVEKGEERLFAMRDMAALSHLVLPAPGAAVVAAAVPGTSPGTSELRTGQVWRSSKTWWRLVSVDAGSVVVEGPRGCVRTSRDEGRTWSGLATSMTRAGFEAWIRKSGAILTVEATPFTVAERMAVAICKTGIGESFLTKRTASCVCARDGRRPVTDIPRCRECLLAAAAVLDLDPRGNPQ